MAKVKTSFDKVVDSGARQEFATGSVRDTSEGKGAWGLMPYWSLLRLANHYHNGQKKYGSRNWEKGQYLLRYAESAARHLFKYIGGCREEDHLAAAAWNVFAIMHTEKMIEMGKLPAYLAEGLADHFPNPEETAKCKSKPSVPQSSRPQGSAKPASKPCSKTKISKKKAVRRRK